MSTRSFRPLSGPPSDGELYAEAREDAAQARLDALQDVGCDLLPTRGALWTVTFGAQLLGSAATLDEATEAAWPVAQHLGLVAREVCA